MSQQQVDAVRKQLTDSLLKKEMLNDQLETVQTQIKALRNLLAGVELGLAVAKEEKANEVD